MRIQNKKKCFMLFPVLAVTAGLLFMEKLPDNARVSAESNAATFTSSSSRIVYDTGISSGIMGIDSQIALPVGYAANNMDAKAALKVEKDGEVVSGYDNVTQYADTFTFSAAGEYTFSYTTSAGENEEFIIEVRESAPTVTCTYRLPYIMEAGTTVSAPETTFVADGNTLEKEVNIVYPDGYAYKMSSVALYDAGNYTIEYKTSVNDKQYKFTKSFYIVGLIDEYNTSSAPTYGKISFENELKSMGSYAKEGSAKLKIADAAVNVQLGTNEYYTHGQVIDLSALTMSDKLFTAYVAPTGRTSAGIYVDLIDVNDENNYLSVYFDSVPYQTADHNAYRTYVRAAVPSIGQNYTGKDQYNSGVLYARRGGGFYTATDLSGAETTEYYPISFSYDQNKNSVYSYIDDGDTPYIVAKMDDDTTPFDRYYTDKGLTPNVKGYFPNCAWKGFSSSLVYLRVRAVCSNTVSMAISKIGNVDMQPTFDSLLQEEEEDNFICLEEKLDLSNLPKAIVGESYNLPAIVAFDNRGKDLDIDCRIYHDGNQNVQIANDGETFIPPFNGTYNVYLTAKDRYGFTAKMQYKIQAVSADDYTPVDLELEQPQAMTTGVEYALPRYTVLNGIATVQIKITAPDGSISYIQEGEALAYKPVLVGEYQVVYVARDYLGKVMEKTVTIDSIPNAEPMFEDEVILPAFLIANTGYELPKLSAVDYKTMGKAMEVECTVQVFEGDSATPIDVVGNYYVPKLSSYGKARIVYVAETEFGRATKTYEVVVQNVVAESGALALENYFVAENAVVSTLSDGVRIATAKSGTTVDFIQPVLLVEDGFMLDFYVLKNANNVQSINVYLRDIYDANVVVKFTVYKGNEEDNALYSYACINDGEEQFLFPGSFFNNEENGKFSIEYYNSTKTISSWTGITKQVATTLSGEPFEGFASNFVYVQIEFGQIIAEKTSAIKISQINNQPFNASYAEDYTVPQILVEQHRPSCQLKELATVSNAIAADILSNTANVYVTVTDSDGKVVTSIDGIALDMVDATRSYQFLAQKQGDYSVVYKAYDGSGNGIWTQGMKVITVIHTVPPTLWVMGDIETTLSLQDGKATLDLPTMYATDSEGTNLEVVCYFQSTDEGLIKIESRTVNFTKKGVYTLIFSATDASGNVVAQTVEVKVL